MIHSEAAQRALAFIKRRMDTRLARSSSLLLKVLLGTERSAVGEEPASTCPTRDEASGRFVTLLLPAIDLVACLLLITFVSACPDLLFPATEEPRHI